MPVFFYVTTPLNAGLIPAGEYELQTISDNINLVQVPDAASIVLDLNLGSYFQINSPGSRSLVAPINPPPAGQTRTIQVSWKNTGVGNASLSLASGVGGWRLGDLPGGIHINNTQSNKRLRITAVYDPVDLRWDIVNIVNQVV